MDVEQERLLYQRQAELCQTLAEPTRLEILHLLGERPHAVKELVQATGQRQAKVSQHLSLLRQRGVVASRRCGTEIRYSLQTPDLLEACRITRAVVLHHFDEQFRLAGQFVTREQV